MPPRLVWTAIAAPPRQRDAWAEQLDLGPFIHKMKRYPTSFATQESEHRHRSRLRWFCCKLPGYWWHGIDLL